ncbi:hypothetical protein G7046_g5702 [Stylonectria norvegica]|nr:hypothetical protein G7046_g5702 [Stylonectria norvegica]
MSRKALVPGEKEQHEARLLARNLPSPNMAENCVYEDKAALNHPAEQGEREFNGQPKADSLTTVVTSTGLFPAVGRRAPGFNAAMRRCGCAAMDLTDCTSTASRCAELDGPTPPNHVTKQHTPGRIASTYLLDGLPWGPEGGYA